MTRPIERLLLIDEMIRAEDYPSVQVFSRHFAISERAVYADLRYLRERFHAPLQFSKKQGGYFYTLLGWNLAKADSFGEPDGQDKAIMKSPNDYAQVKFRPGAKGPLIESLLSRSEEQTDRAFSETAKRDLTDYYALLPLCLPKFSEEEWMILFQALNGWEATPKTAHLLWAEVDSFLEPLKNQYLLRTVGHTFGTVDDSRESISIEDEEFVTRLRMLTTFECWTIYNKINHSTTD